MSILLAARVNILLSDWSGGDSKAEMKACLWKLPLEAEIEELEDDGSVNNLIKIADLGTEQHGNMK